MIKLRYNKTRKVLIFWCLFVGIGAMFGGISMLIDPTGGILRMESMLPYFKVLPFSKYLFQDYIFSGIALIIVNGLTNLTAAYLLIKNKKLGIILGSVFGVTLMLWITIQFVIFPSNILSTTYFIIELIQFITGYMTYVFYTQENFQFNINDYTNIGKDKSTLVVYFSRMGYTKKIAYVTANKIGADIVGLTTKEKTDGTLGFWWCGRFGMHKWRMKINEVNKEINKHKKVIIVSPIWVFNICAPIRDFAYTYKDKINEVEYIVTHFMNSKFNNAKKELDNILDKKCTKFTSICIRLGKVKKIN